MEKRLPSKSEKRRRGREPSPGFFSMRTLPPAILGEARVWALHPARWSATALAEKLATRGYPVKPNTVGRWAWRVRELAYGKVPADVGSPSAVTVTLAFASADAAIQFLSRATPIGKQEARS